MKSNTQKIAEFLENKRLENGMSIYEIADALGASRSNMGRIFSGKNCVSGELFLKICKHLNVSGKEIFLLLSDINFPKK